MPFKSLPVINLYISGVSEKKYSIADYQYFENGKTKQCDIFRAIKYKLYLVEYKVSTLYVIRK